MGKAKSCHPGGMSLEEPCKVHGEPPDQPHSIACVLHEHLFSCQGREEFLPIGLTVPAGLGLGQTPLTIELCGFHGSSDRRLTGR